MAPESPSNDQDERRGKGRRKRHGRFRRWLVRPFMWALASGALLIFGLHWALQTTWAGRFFAEKASAGLTDFLDRPVKIEQVHLRLLPLGVELEGFELAGPGPNDPAVVTFSRLLVDVQLLDLQKRAITIEEVVVEEPRIHLELLEPGVNNLPYLGDRGQSDDGLRNPIRVHLRRLALAGGELSFYQSRIPIDVDAQALNAELTGSSGNQLTGRVVAGNIDFQIAKANQISAAVALRLSLGPEGLKLLSGRLSSPDLTANLTADVSWAEKTWVFEVEGQGDASMVQRLGYLEDKIEGPIEFNGGIAWSERSWGFRADADSSHLTLFNRDFYDIKTAVSGDRNGVRFDLKQAAYAEGSLSGSVNIDTEKIQDARSLEADLMLEGLDLQYLLDDQNIPVEDHLASRVNGVFDYRFDFGDAAHGQGWADLTIVPRLDRQPEDLALEGSADLLIDQGVFRTQAARLSGPYQRLLIDGYWDFPAKRGEFGFELDSDRVERLEVLLPFDSEEPELWMPTSGRGRFDGTLSVAAGQASTLLRLDLEDVVAPGAEADRVQGALAIGVDGVEDLRLELLRPDAGLIVTGSMPFNRQDRPASEIPFAMSIDAASWPMDQVRPWLPMEVPIDGPVSGSIQLWGELDELNGQLRVAIRPARMEDLTLDEIELRMGFDPIRLQIDRLAATVPAGEIVLSGGLDQLSDQLDLQITSGPLQMDQEPFAGMMPGDLTGQLEMTGTLVGSLASPRVEGDLRWRELRLGGGLLGQQGTAAIHLAIRDKKLELSGDLLGLASIEGGGPLDEAGFDLSFAVASESLGEVVLLGSSEPNLAVTGTSRGMLSISGSFDTDAPWQTELELSELNIAYEGLQLENIEPLVARLNGDSIHIDSLFIGEPGTDSEFFLIGSITTEDDPALDLRVQSSLDTNWLDLVQPDFGLREGRFDVLATIGGTLAAPLINGQGRLVGGRAVVEGLPFSIRNLEGVVLFDPEQVILDGFTAAGAGGTFQASGTARLFEADGQIDYRIQVHAEDITVAFPEGWTTRGKADLIMASTETGQEIRGAIDVEQALYLQDVNLSLTQMLSGLFTRQRLEVERADDLAATTEINITLRGDDGLRVRNNIADLTGDLDLLVRGTLARPVVFGNVILEPEGTMELGPNEYTIERGRLSFNNPYRIEPTIDLVAQADVREFDITLNLSGTLDRLETSFSSNPPLADLEILSLLAGGEQSWTGSGGFTGGTSQEESTTQQQAANLIYGQAASLVTQRTGQLFGLDRFRVQPLTSSTGELSSARITVGKQLSRDVFVTYSWDPSKNDEQIFQFEWDVSRQSTLILTQNGDESYAVDVRWQKSF